MRYNRYLLFSTALLLLSLSLITCVKDDLLDENNNLLLKSFPEIYDVKSVISSSTEAAISFKVRDVVKNDPIIEQIIEYSLLDNPTTIKRDTLSYAIDPNNYNKTYTYVITDLEVGTKYKYNFILKTEKQLDTEQEEVNTFTFINDDYIFETFQLNIILDTIIEFESQLKATVFGRIEDYDDLKLGELGDTLIFEWLEIDNINNSNIKEVKLHESNFTDGNFSADFVYYDFSKTYKLRACINYNDQKVCSVSSIDQGKVFQSESEGDFWVDISELPVLDDNLNITIGQDINTLKLPHEGAVSFKEKGINYVGLGKRGSTYQNTFFTYNPTKNFWEQAAVDFPGDARAYATVFNKGGTTYVGGGCKDCDAYEDFLDENKNHIKTLTSLKDFENNIFIDFYPYNGSTGDKINLPTPLLAAYGVNNYVGGGLKMVYKEGNINYGNNENYENNQIDPGEWHDLNENGKPDYYHRPESMFDLDNLLQDVTIENDKIKIPFCKECVGSDPCGESDLLDAYLYFDISKDSINGREFKSYNNLILKVDDKGTLNEFSLVDNGSISIQEDNCSCNSSIPNFHFTYHLTLDNPIEKIIWKDRNNNGVININMVKECSELFTMNMNDTITDLTFLENTNSIEFLDGEDKVIFSRAGEFENGVNIFDAVIKDLTTSLGTLWIDKDGNGNDLVSYDELYINNNNNEIDPQQSQTPEFWTEWIETNGNTYPDEIYNTFYVNDTLTLINASGNSTTSMSINQRYAPTIWNLKDGRTYMIAGGNSAPISDKDQPNRILKWNGTQWIMNGIVTPESFEDRVHSFSFVINGKAYVGGGEGVNGKSVNFDLWQFDPDASMNNFKEVTGCGVSRLSKGVGFSADGKGYVLGINEEGELQFWAYIPPIP